MSKNYKVTEPLGKEVTWEQTVSEYFLSLAEIIEAANKEFPAVPFEELVIEAGGYDAEFLTLHRLLPEEVGGDEKEETKK